MDETPGILYPSQYKLIEAMCARNRVQFCIAMGPLLILATRAQQYYPFHILTGATFHIKSISQVQFELSLLFLMIEHLEDE